MRFRIALIFVLAGTGTALGGGPTLLGDPRDEFARAIAEFDQAHQQPPKNRDQARRLFLAAARRLETIASTGVANGKLEYNLGNCYLQAGDVGRAILHYRRAQRLIPGDPLLADNLREARSRRLTSIRPKRGSALMRSVLFVHYAVSAKRRAQAGVIAYTLFWTLLACTSFRKRRSVVVATFVCFLVAASLGASLAVSRWSDRNAPAGVIIAMDVAAYKGPGSAYQRRFEQPLQPGVEFTLKGRRGDWYQIELPDGQAAWIEADQAVLVPPEAS